MFQLNHEKKIQPPNCSVNIFDIAPINEKENRIRSVPDLSYNKFSLSKKLYKDKNDLSNPTLLEMELTPNAKKYIKSMLSPFAVFSYILQESSIAFGKVVAATISFLVFSLINCIPQASIGSYEVKLPLISICLVGSILGARDLVRSIKKIILSIPTGIMTCYKNISSPKCSILDFICGLDKHNQNIIKKISKKLF